MNKGKFVILFSCFSNICGVFSSHLLDKTTIQTTLRSCIIQLHHHSYLTVLYMGVQVYSCL